MPIWLLLQAEGARAIAYTIANSYTTVVDTGCSNYNRGNCHYRNCVEIAVKV